MRWFVQPQDARGFEFSYPWFPLAAQGEKGFGFSLLRRPRVRVSASLGTQRGEGVEFFQPDTQEPLHGHSEKFLGAPKMACLFINSFIKWPVFANLRTAGFGQPLAAEGFEFSSPCFPLAAQTEKGSGFHCSNALKCASASLPDALVQCFLGKIRFSFVAA